MSRVAALLCLLSVCAVAQPLLPIPGGNIILTDSNPVGVSVYDPQTSSQTLLTNNSAIMVPSGVVVTDQREAVFGDFIGLSVHKVDMLGTFTTIASGLLNNPVRVAQDFNGDIVFTGNALIYAPASIMRIDSGGNVLTAAVLPGNGFGILVDANGISNAGDYIVAMPLVGDLVRVDGAGTVTAISTGLIGPTGVARFRNGDYAVTLQYTDEIVRVPRAGGAATPFVPAGSGLGNIKDIISDFNGGFYVTEAGGALGSRLMHIDESGTTITQVLGNGSFGLFQSCAVAPNVVVPANINTGSLFGLELDFPAHPGKIYQTFMAGSVYPGISFPGADPRGTPLNPDPLFLSSFGVGAPGITTGWTGPLGGAGEGLLLIDLSPYPVGAFSGSRVHMQVGVFDLASPTGIAQLSNLATLAFP